MDFLIDKETFQIMLKILLGPHLSFFGLGPWAIIMPQCACASEVYGSVFVCLSVCVCRLLQLHKDQ